IGATTPWSSAAGGRTANPIGEDLLKTGPVAAEETSDLEPKLDRSTLPGKIVQRACVAAMDALRDPPASGTATGRAACCDDDGHLVGGNQDVLKPEGVGIGE